jgi:hypothetical protein
MPPQELVKDSMLTPTYTEERLEIDDERYLTEPTGIQVTEDGRIGGGLVWPVRSSTP